MTIFLGGRKGDREIILGVVIDYIFKHITKDFCRKILRNGDTAAVLPRHVEFEAICGTHYYWCEFKAGKKKKIHVIYMSVASETRREF